MEFPIRLKLPHILSILFIHVNFALLCAPCAFA